MSAYTVTRKDGVSFVTGAIPLMELAAILRGAGSQVADPDLAKLLGASIAWGTRENMDAMKSKMSLAGFGLNNQGISAIQGRLAE